LQQPAVYELSLYNLKCRFYKLNMGNLKKTLAIIIVAASLLTLAGCSDNPVSVHFEPPHLARLNYRGFFIPKFPDPDEQLNYARLWFRDINEKKAALEVVPILYPGARLQCGEAFLNLAYMDLGSDYRFTTPEKCGKAIASYRNAIEKFKDVPAIQVKAYWYLGWIYCDLLGKDRKGVRNFWIVVKKYPDLSIGISPPVPWISLVYPVRHRNDQPVNDESQKQWAGIALMEIIRHAQNDGEVWQAFNILWEKYRRSISTGLALKTILQNRQNMKTRVLPFVEPYLELKVANEFLAEEIKKIAGG